MSFLLLFSIPADSTAKEASTKELEKDSEEDYRTCCSWASEGSEAGNPNSTKAVRNIED